MMNEGAQRSAALTTALRPLWDTFNEDQKRIAPPADASISTVRRRNDRGGRRGWPRTGPRRHAWDGAPRPRAAVPDPTEKAAHWAAFLCFP